MSAPLIITVMTFDRVHLLFSQFNKPTCVVETTAGHLYALQNIIAAKNTCVESTQEANKRVERGLWGDGVVGQPPLTKNIIKIALPT